MLNVLLLGEDYYSLLRSYHTDAVLGLPRRQEEQEQYVRSEIRSSTFVVILVNDHGDASHPSSVAWGAPTDWSQSISLENQGKR